jgi:hypothetical protein
MEKPRIFIINGIYKFYEDAAEIVVKTAQRNGVEVKKSDNRITIPNDNQLLKDIINLSKQAQEKDDAKDEDEVFVLDEKKGIRIDVNKKRIITSVHFLSYSKFK